LCVLLVCATVVFVLLLQSKSRLDLVVFRCAAEHMTRISRIIKQPYGNALLVGACAS
jgi:dynein heavy chain